MTPGWERNAREKPVSHSSSHSLFPSPSLSPPFSLSPCLFLSLSLTPSPSPPFSLYVCVFVCAPVRVFLCVAHCVASWYEILLTGFEGLSGLLSHYIQRNA